MFQGPYTRTYIARYVTVKQSNLVGQEKKGHAKANNTHLLACPSTANGKQIYRAGKPPIVGNVTFDESASAVANEKPVNPEPAARNGVSATTAEFGPL